MVSSQLEFDTTYHFKHKILGKVLNKTDLEILLDHKLWFPEYIAMMVNKANGVLRFVKHWSKEFTDPYVTKQLYISLVWAILEYGSFMWDQHFLINVNFIQSVQKRFLLFCLKGFEWNSFVLVLKKSH